MSTFDALRALTLTGPDIFHRSFLVTVFILIFSLLLSKKNRGSSSCIIVYDLYKARGANYNSLSIKNHQQSTPDFSSIPATTILCRPANFY